jgi:hypothetical protein
VQSIFELHLSAYVSIRQHTSADAVWYQERAVDFFELHLPHFREQFSHQQINGTARYSLRERKQRAHVKQTVDCDAQREELQG